jgi:hypothetical protein
MEKNAIVAAPDAVFDNAGEMERIYAWFSDADATMAFLKEKGFTPEPAAG